MARTIGTVKSISGKAEVKTPNDKASLLKVGDAVEENALVSAVGTDSKVTLTLEGGRELTLNGNDEILLDKSVFAAFDEGAALDVKALQQALADALNPDNMEETAAGQEVVGEANAGAEYASRNDARGNPSSYLTGTENDSPEITTEENDINRLAESPVVVDPNDDQDGDDDGDDDTNNPPNAVDDSSNTGQETYTIHVGGQDNGWDHPDLTITALVGSLDINPGNGKLGVDTSNGTGKDKVSDSPLIDNSGIDEGVKFTFDHLLNQANVELSSFNTANTGTDMLTWQALIGSSIVASGTFQSSANADTLIIDTGDKVFNTLIIGAGEGEGTNFFIDAISASGPEWDAYLTVTENMPVSISELDLIANDSDIDGDTINIESIDTSGTIGNVDIDSEGNVTYDPAGRFDYLAAGEVATDTFSYSLSDGALSDTAEVTITIIGSSTDADNVLGIDIHSLADYDGGLGYDTVILSGSDSSIDFNELSSKFTNVEHLDLKDGGKELLNITPESILSMTDDDNYLRISGESDDKLELSGFDFDADASANLEGYNVYTGTFNGAEVTLHIDEDITNINIIIP